MSPFNRGDTITRLEAFSDAVFGFSATLLVVSLEVPNTIPELVTDLKGFIAFGLSFLALILIWSVHNAFYRRYDLEDRWTIILNSCLLFVVLFYVYPLKFVTEGIAGMFGVMDSAAQITSLGELSTMFMLYGGGFVAVFLCVALLYLHAWRSRDKLGLTPVEANWALFYFRNYMILVGVGLLSVLISWAHIGLSFGLPGLVYCLLGPLCYGHAKWTAAYKTEPVENLSKIK